MSSRLVIDVGNTNIDYGIFIDGELSTPESIPTNEILNAQDIENVLGKFLNNLDIIVSEAVICCGVARITSVLQGCTSFENMKVSYLNGKNSGGAKIDYETPETLGPDRVANTIAATQIYGSPVLVVDCGTAINIDLIDRDGQFSGGIIYPGLHTGRDALASHAPALPEVQITGEVKLIGRNTIECIQSGLINGAVALINHVIDEVSNYNEGLIVVITGGHGPIIHPLLHSGTILDVHMTLKGLGLANLGV